MVNATSLYPAPNFTTVRGMFDYVNSVTDSLFSPLSLFLLFIVVFISLKKHGTDKSFATASFITMIVSMLYLISGLVSEYVAILFVFMTGISVALMMKGD